MNDGDAMLEKVTAFVTRGPVSDRELLVFRHPNGSIQVPAGTVEEGESPDDAVLRETWEETGLRAVRIVTALGAQAQRMHASERVVLRKVRLLQRPAPESPVALAFSSFLGLRRGLYLRQTGETNGRYAPVAYEEFDSPADESPIPSRSILGWVEANALASTVVRHFYHLTLTEPTPDAWTQIAEEWEHSFELHWVPLSRPTVVAGLVPSQQAWLDEFGERLLVDDWN